MHPELNHSARMDNHNGQHPHPHYHSHHPHPHHYHPHHRSSEVYSSSVFGSASIKSTIGTTSNCLDGQSQDDFFDITMVKPITIEDAIKRMQRVPSVEFTCSLTKKLSIVSDYRPSSLSRSNLTHPLNHSMEEDDADEEEDLTEERRDHFSPTLPNGIQPIPNYFARPKYQHQVSYDKRVDESSGVSPNEQSKQKLSLYKRSYSIHVDSRSSLNKPVTSNTAPLVNRTISSNSSQRSTATPTSTMANLTAPNSTSLVTARRPTMARLGSESADSEHYFVPRESWLTSLYVKLPKSKSFCRLQLELLNLPLFASVGRFLEETCTTTCDQKALLEDNSFLFTLFNQFVPHNRIPLDTLSKYVRRLQKYEILATIEFNFLKTPSINRRANSSCSTGSISSCSHQQHHQHHHHQQQSQSKALQSNHHHLYYHRHRYTIASSSSCSMRQANKRENLSKNTNQRYVPYDYNRVVLRSDEFRKCNNSDYINASHIDSLLKPNAYIVAQGPNEFTIGDFWCMIWQQNIHVVVMLTKVYEFIRVMCTPYWPNTVNHPEVYDGQFEVTLIDEDKLADYIVRTMKVRCLRPTTSKAANVTNSEDEIECVSTGDKESHNQNSSSKSNTTVIDDGEYRTIYQLHFLSWNINSCPYSDSILKFRRRVQIYEKQCRNANSANNNNLNKSGPLLVHCSNGCGRSGSYVCLDANLALADEEGVVDIFNYAKSLRKARVDMIENLEQYKFIYETIEESHVCGKTWFHIGEISQQMKHKSVKNKVTKKNEYQNEFEKLMRMTSKFSIGDCAGGHRLENRDKNRDVSIVPPDNFRPYLTSFQCNNEQTDYINAVFVDGYSRPREYIVTEWPLKKTVSDIWSLIYDHDCNTVVVLGGVPPNCSKSFPMFWPRDQGAKTVKYGSIFSVETISTNHPPNISSWVLRVNKKVTSLTELMAGIKAEPKITQLFEFGAWPYDYKVPTSTNALVELIHMVERWRQRTSYGPVLVVSGNGKSRVGVYCAANFAIEQVVAHEEIDIFNAVKTVRRHRSALIETIMEYKYCYDLTLHYVSHYMNKSNYNQIFRKNL